MTEKRFDVNEMPPMIYIGMETEHEVEHIGFDAAAWLEKWPEMQLSVWARLPGAETMYEAASHMDGATIWWDVSGTDTSVMGDGRVLVVGVTPDGARKISGSARTYIRETGMDATGEAPQAQQPWYHQAMDAARRAEEAADLAQTVIGESVTVEIADLVWVEKKYIDGTTGEIGSTATYDYAEFDVSGFTQVTGTAYFANDAGFAFYRADGVCLGAKNNTRPNTYICAVNESVPEGAVLMRVSHRTGRDYTLSLTGVRPPLPDRMKEVEKRIGDMEKVVQVKNSADKVSAQTMTAGNTIRINAPNTKSGNVISFIVGVETMGTLRIGHGTDAYAGSNVQIDASTIKVRKVESEGGQLVGIDVQTLEHGLTLTSFLCVIIRTHGDNTADITLVSEGGSYKIDHAEWIGSSGNVYAMSISGTYTDCRLSYYCADVPKPVWVFGDSYLSQWNVYAQSYGAKAWLNDSYSGRNSSQAAASLQKLLKRGVPKLIVWAMGMNDQESVSWGLTQWQSGYDTVKAICENRGIELVLTTIPNTPTRSNAAKNEIIRNSGYRYVDIAEAVGASDTGSGWYTGLLSGDNVHPTQQGQSVIAARMIADVPEMCG